MKHLFTALIVAALSCASAHAQTFDARAQVPFQFRVGNHLMPAGKYTVHQSNFLLKLSEERGKASVFRITTPASQKTVSDKSVLSFTRYRDEFHLTGLWYAGSKEGQALMPTAREKELARATKPADSATAVLEASAAH
jgi:hypothetical protein